MDLRYISRRSHGLRESLSVFHLVVMTLGAILVCLGAFTINSTASKSISLVLLVGGTLISIVSFTGYFGAHAEHPGFLKTYSCTTALLLIIQLVMLGLVYVNRAEIPRYASRAWDFFHNNDPQLLVQLEQSFQCCGYNSPEDRPEPSTCPVMVGNIESVLGCKDALVSSMHPWHDSITVGVVLLLGLQMTALLTSIILAILMERAADEERIYRTLLSRQPNTHSWLNSTSPSLSSNSGGSPVFGRYSAPTRSRSSIYNQPLSPSYSPSQRIPRYGTTLSTSSK